MQKSGYANSTLYKLSKESKSNFVFKIREKSNTSNLLKEILILIQLDEKIYEKLTKQLQTKNFI